MSIMNRPYPSLLSMNSYDILSLFCWYLPPLHNCFAAPIYILILLSISSSPYKRPSLSANNVIYYWVITLPIIWFCLWMWLNPWSDVPMPSKQPSYISQSNNIDLITLTCYMLHFIFFFLFHSYSFCFGEIWVFSG